MGRQNLSVAVSSVADWAMEHDLIFRDLPRKPLLRVEEVAVFFDVSPRTIRNWYFARKLCGCKPNGSMRIYRHSVIELVRCTEGDRTQEQKRRKSSGL